MENDRKKKSLPTKATEPDNPYYYHVDDDPCVLENWILDEYDAADPEVD